MSQTAENLNAKALSLVVKIADHPEEVEQALRLRYEVFAEEENNLLLYNEEGIETDLFDPYCDHLIVKDMDTNAVVGTYRLLPGQRAVRHAGFYSETEFDLTSFTYKQQSLELGRSCIAYEYRGSKAIQLLWEGIANYISEHGYQYLIGCASVRIRNIDELNEMYSYLLRKGIMTDRFGVRPLASHHIQGLQEIELSGDEKEIFRRLPPLMKGYQWLGAEIGGAPAHDPIFETIDFFIILETSRVTKKYQRHFLVDRNL